MKAWNILLNVFTGEPTSQLVCGECSDKFDDHELQPVSDHREYDSEKCSICEKNCGDYFAHFERKKAA
jgi:hypothetical protein